MTKDAKVKDEAPAVPVVDAFAAIGSFKPKVTEIKPGVSAATEAIKKDLDVVATENGFVSREAKPAGKAKAKTTTRARFNQAEPTRQLNIRVTEVDHDRFYAMAKERGITHLRELFHDALDALDALVAASKKGK